jgi:hypothetical protein
MVKNGDRLAGKSALRKQWRTFHEKDDIIAFDDLIDPFVNAHFNTPIIRE